MARLVVLPPSLTGTAPTFQSLAGSPVLTTVAGRAGTHPTLVPLPCLTDVPASRVPTSNTPPLSGRAGSSTPPARPMAAVALSGAAMGRNVHGRTERRAAPVRESKFRIITGGAPCDAPKKGTRIEPMERGGWTTCPSRTAPRPIRPLAGCGRKSTVVQHPALLNIGLEVPRTMNTPHPMDEEVLSMHDTRAAAIRVFSRDGVIDADERYVLDRIDGHRSFFSTYRLKEIAAMSWLRNGASRLTRRRFNDAGYELHLVPDSTDKIIPFPTTRNEIA